MTFNNYEKSSRSTKNINTQKSIKSSVIEPYSETQVEKTSAAKEWNSPMKFGNRKMSGSGIGTGTKNLAIR
jgi:hypothetical protein